MDWLSSTAGGEGPGRPIDDGRPSRARAVYFGPADAGLFGWYHAPIGGPARRAGVVLAGPMHYEALCAHRAMRHLAERLASAGFAVLRLDPHGTGDSAGGDRDPGRVEAWLRSFDHAIEELRAISGAEDVSLCGVRLGATLAIAAAARRGDVASLVIVAPCPTGRAYVREVRAFRLMKEATRPPTKATAEGGDEEAAGFVITAETAGALSRLKPLAGANRPAARALVVGRDDDVPGDDQVAAQLRDAGVATDHRKLAGYADLMQDAHKSVVPRPMIEAIAAWLDEAHPPAPGRATPTLREGARASIDLGPVREHAVRFGDGDRLFGVVTERAGDATRAPRATIVLINPGSVHRIGSNRMHVSLARAWAALGFTVLRMDVAGLGDSAPAAGRPENETYSATATADVEAAMDLLGARFGASRFVLAGLCSGAYVAFHTGLASDRVAGCVLVNPQTFHFGPGDSLDVTQSKIYGEVQHYQGALRHAGSWRKLLRGEVDLRRAARSIGRRAITLADARLGPTLARFGLGSAHARVGGEIASLVDRGVDTLIVFSAGDPGLDYLDLYAREKVAELRARRSFRLAVIDDADHTFTPVAKQEELRALVTAHLVDRWS